MIAYFFNVIQFFYPYYPCDYSSDVLDRFNTELFESVS